ncbi:MAG: hypothetical protein RMH84_01240 [Sulfolobales archaeon]|nr:hypothetical protein [Sulfolobales archaeon]MCX8208035.1 hypothetical protein [Sulfolobales archaeon]MDW8010210.1 hypothetical protein [Sulfolobales archaeon]
MKHADRYLCVVCGRVFPRGQGIVIRVEDRELAFHSSKCAARFYKMLIDRGSKEVISESIRLARELGNMLERRREATSKKI